LEAVKKSCKTLP